MALGQTKDLLSVKETANRLGCSTARMYRLIEQGRCPATRISPRRITIPTAALDAWLREMADEASKRLRATAGGEATNDAAA